MRGNSHVRCGAGEKMEIISKSYLLLLSPTSKRMMELTLEKKIAHGGHPVLSWMVDNIIKTDPAGNIKPDKAKSTEKIDGVVAMIMALDRAIRNNGDIKNIYERRGMRSVLD